MEKRSVDLHDGFLVKMEYAIFKIIFLLVRFIVEMEVNCFVSSLPFSLHINVKLFREMSSSSISMTFLVLRIHTLLQKFYVFADLLSL